MKILFVCLGNICRSPLAEAIFQHKVNKKGLESRFQVASCGTANYHIGEPPDRRTIANALKNGIVIQHLGRQLASQDFEDFDLILAMDQSNFDNILRVKSAIHHRNKIVLMREFDPQGKGMSVPDPYYGTEEDFQEVFRILDRATDGLMEHLTNAGD